MFPYVVDLLSFFGSHKMVGFWMQIVLSYMNTLMLYRLGKRVFGERADADRIAELSARFYLASHSCVYQIAFYSENTFLFLSLLGLTVMYAGKQSDGLPSTHNVIAGTFLFGLATCARSTGLLLSVFVGFFMLNKVIRRLDRFCRLFKYILFTWFAAIVMILPLWVVIYWKPYLLHCETKLERSNEIPAWCLDSLPNVYNHI